jgi:hypothetical protein
VHIELFHKKLSKVMISCDIEQAATLASSGRSSPLARCQAVQVPKWCRRAAKSRTASAQRFHG